MPGTHSHSPAFITQQPRMSVHMLRLAPICFQLIRTNTVCIRVIGTSEGLPDYGKAEVAKLGLCHTLCIGSQILTLVLGNRSGIMMRDARLSPHTSLY